MGTMKCSPKFYCPGQFKAFQSVIQVFFYSVQETWLSCLFKDFLFPQKQLLRKMNYLLLFRLFRGKQKGWILTIICKSYLISAQTEPKYANKYNTLFF